MKNTPVGQRGGLRIASFLFVAAALALIALAPIDRATVEAAGPEPAEAAEAYTVRVTVGSSGFEPKRITVPLGVVHFVVTAREGDHCFAIPSLDVEKRVRAGRPLEVDVTFDRAGEFPFLCCVEGSGTAEVGAIVVASGK